MSSRFTNPKANRARLVPAYLALAGLAALISAVDQAGAAGRHGAREVESVATRIAGEPIMAIVSLHSQLVTVYDAKGWILRAPVSTGQKGRETPAGIFSIIQKQAEHYSNLYDDAYMPHMQRITWSGIALHGGPLPGYPASHGCIRMPFDFAAQLFDETHWDCVVTHDDTVADRPRSAAIAQANRQPGGKLLRRQQEHRRLAVRRRDDDR